MASHVPDVTVRLNAPRCPRVRARPTLATRSSPLRGLRGGMAAPIALTGVPGSGKSATAARLAARLRTIEVSELAIEWGLARRRAGPIWVDLAKMRRRYRRTRPRTDVIVGRLAHLLPVRDVVVLRCHPEVLEKRLRRAARGSARERRENFAAEALDVILVEAMRPGRRVWEIDTTHRSPDDVARLVYRIWKRRPSPRYGAVDWLADPVVTEHLLDRTQ
jgi:adenylate kinase